MKYTFEIYKDSAGEFRVRFKYNGEIMFSSEGYSSKQSALNLILSIKRNAPDAPVEDTTKPARTRKTKETNKDAPVAWLLRETFAGKTRILAGAVYMTARAAKIAAARKSIYGRICEAVPVYEKDE